MQPHGKEDERELVPSPSAEPIVVTAQLLQSKDPLQLRNLSLSPALSLPT